MGAFKLVSGAGSGSGAAVEADGIMELLRKEAEERKRELSGTRANPGQVRQIFDEGSSDNERRSEHKVAEIFGTNRTYVNQAGTHTQAAAARELGISEPAVHKNLTKNSGPTEKVNTPKEG
jgi:hypothetical protein